MPNIITGTLTDDILGGDLNINGYTLNGLDGEDLLLGSNGNDLMLGGDDNDVLVGAGGDDNLNGQNGDDILRGGNGDDTLSGGQGDDLLNGGRGDDFLFGGAGDDIIFGVKGNNTIDGGAGNDWISTGDQASVVDGGVGNDIILIRTKKGADHIVTGGAGNDEFEFIQLANSRVSDVTITDFDTSQDTMLFDDLAGRVELATFFSGGGLFVVEPNDDFPFPGGFEEETIVSDVIDIDGSVVIQLETGDSITLSNVTRAELVDYAFNGEVPPFIDEVFT